MLRSVSKFVIWKLSLFNLTLPRRQFNNQLMAIGRLVLHHLSRTLRSSLILCAKSYKVQVYSYRTIVVISKGSRHKSKTLEGVIPKPKLNSILPKNCLTTKGNKTNLTSNTARTYSNCARVKRTQTCILKVSDTSSISYSRHLKWKAKTNQRASSKVSKVFNWNLTNRSA